MRFLTKEQTAQWCADRSIDVTWLDGQVRKSTDVPHLRFAFPKPAYRLAWLAKWLVATLPGTGDRLLWVSQWGIWPSSENWPMYRLLRHGAGDDRDIQIAPGLVASGVQIDELAGFVQLAMMFGWDSHMWSAKNEVHAFISHDEWVSMESSDSSLIEQAKGELKTAHVILLSAQAA